MYIYLQICLQLIFTATLLSQIENTVQNISLTDRVDDLLNKEITDRLVNADFYCTNINEKGVVGIVMLNINVDTNTITKIKEFNASYKGNDIRQILLKNASGQIIEDTANPVYKGFKKYLASPNLRLLNENLLTKTDLLLKEFKSADIIIGWDLITVKNQLELQRFYITYSVIKRLEDIQFVKSYIFLDFQLEKLLSFKTYNALKEKYWTSDAFLSIPDEINLKLLRERENKLKFYQEESDLTEEASIELLQLHEELLEY